LTHAEIKTQKTKQSVDAFLKTVKDEKQRTDASVIMQLMKKATKSDGAMWGTTIIGFGDYLYKYPNGRTMDWFSLGFSPRSGKFALYLLGEKGEKYNSLLEKLGKYKIGGGCLYIKKIEDIDTKILQQILELQVKACSAK
jgi:hypothetical protein